MRSQHTGKKLERAAKIKAGRKYHRQQGSGHSSVFLTRTPSTKNTIIGPDDGPNACARPKPFQNRRPANQPDKQGAADIMNLRAYAHVVGAEPGSPLGPDQTTMVLEKIIGTVGDLFVSSIETRRYFSDARFGSTNETATDMIARGRVTSVLARMNELRFGASG